jgi:prepilin-type N-terminal cleavage/methylation domain-containing protein
MAFKSIGIKGFTLLEIIVSILIAAIMGAVMVQFMGTSMIQSAKPVVEVKNGLILNEIMEKITADYKKLLATDGTPVETLKGYIENGNAVGNVPYYGPYTCSTEYIVFSGGNEVQDTSGTNTLLKVTLTYGNQSLVTLFTK